MQADVAPEWVALLLPIVLWAALAAGVAWLVLAALDYYNRRAHNLTMSDRGGSGGRAPDFLTVDHEKREAARRAGEVFDEKIAARDAAEAAAAAGEPARSPAMGWARIATVFFAVVTVITVAIGAIGRIETFDEGVRRLSSWERFSEIVSIYWLGFLVVAAMVAVQIFHAVRQTQSD